MMEDLVEKMVKEVFEEKASKGFSLAGCYQCRLDVICYVLNRIKPEYLISGRGLAHYEKDYQDHVQKNADIAALINEGIHKIETRQRPYYSRIPPEEDSADIEGPVYNLPAITGRLLHGTTFEPLRDIHIALLENEKPIPMINYTWQNPYYLVEGTRGNFTFLPRPIPAKKEGDTKKVSLEIRVEAERYTSLRHFIELHLEAQHEVHKCFSMENIIQIGELYLFPESQPMEINE
jgi:competence protein ComFB